MGDLEPAIVPWFFHDSPLQLDDPRAPLPTATSQMQKEGPSNPDTPNTSNAPNTSKGNKSSEPLGSKLDKKLQDVKNQGAVPQPGSEQSLDTDGVASPISRKKTPPVFSTLSYVGGVSPNSHWAAFNPSDNYHLENNSENDEVTVGRNRLHTVSLMERQIRPIYWSGSHQSSNVHRATWFYGTTLTPGEPTLEEALVNAIDQVKPWTTTYLTELRAAIGVPEALEKVKIPIEYYQYSDKDKPDEKKTKLSAVVVFAPCCRLEEEIKADENNELYELSKNIDKVHTMSFPVAYLLPPQSNSMMSFISAGPTPVQLLTALLTGKTPQGTLLTLQRHFEWEKWKQLHKLPDRPTDDLNFQPKKIKQLVLVVHGIGQKLSDRVESFNFTYSVNGLRIAVEEQAQHPGINPSIEDGVTVLPVNWRRMLNYEDLKRTKEGNITSKEQEFSLDQITIKSIPAVRNIITDVMLDIPYYMSHYKPIMLKTAVEEANRVYDLFCHHNPEFKQDGTVNIIGHSLGSVIAMDILSSQPTTVANPKTNPDSKTPQFKFDTSNLFLVGSPAGFFLLLENSRLYPRKRCDESEEKMSMYGCLAVDNIYNVFNYSDPVANLLNATVDPVYASNIETATLPVERQFPDKRASTASFFDNITSRLPKPFWEKKSQEQLKPQEVENTEQEDELGKASAVTDEKKEEEAKGQGEEMTSSTASLDSLGQRTHMPSSMPSEVEMETRDFGREYRAEENMKLLNDNGQIDYMIPLTGTLENQYFSMITAHSNYWDNKDFARLVAVECGRERGEENAWHQYKAHKKGEDKLLHKKP